MATTMTPTEMAEWLEAFADEGPKPTGASSPETLRQIAMHIRTTAAAPSEAERLATMYASLYRFAELMHVGVEDAASLFVRLGNAFDAASKKQKAAN